MAGEPDDLTLRLLREIRTKQDDHGQLLERMDRDFQDLRQSVIYSLGLGTAGHLKNQEQDARLDDQKKRLDGLFDQVEDLMRSR